MLFFVIVVVVVVAIIVLFVICFDSPFSLVSLSAFFFSYLKNKMKELKL